MTRIPPASRRLFAHHAAEDLAREEARVFVALRLAEEGDREELRWLVQRLGENELGRIVTRHGPRGLSRRSLAFWRLTLAVAVETSEAGTEVWPR